MIKWHHYIIGTKILYDNGIMYYQREKSGSVSTVWCASVREVLYAICGVMRVVWCAMCDIRSAVCCVLRSVSDTPYMVIGVRCVMIVYAVRGV